jgi:uroporphyrinogen-III decarboxylase
MDIETSHGMTSRERVLAAARGEPVDHAPVMYWLNPHAACRLMAEFQPGRDRIVSWIGRRLWRRFAAAGELDAGQWRRALPLFLTDYANSAYVLDLGADAAWKAPADAKGLGQIRRNLYREHGQLRLRDPWFGSIRGLGGIYADIVDPVIKSADDLAGYRFNDLSDTMALRRFRQAHPEACLLAEVAGVQQALSDIMWRTDQFMLALHDHPAEVAAFQGRLADWIIGLIRNAVSAGADVIFIGDDYGYTGRPLISMQMWREFTYPQLKRLIAAVHEAGALAMLHSCGYQMCFLEYYVEAGLDVLHSFQPLAGNDFEAAYARYGDRLTFATGIDVQQGEWMSPDALRVDILRNYGIGRSRNRFILSMTHMLQYTMPPANALALFDTVREIQAGLHD